MSHDQEDIEKKCELIMLHNIIFREHQNTITSTIILNRIVNLRSDFPNLLGR